MDMEYIPCVSWCIMSDKPKAKKKEDSPRSALVKQYLDAYPAMPKLVELMNEGGDFAVDNRKITKGRSFLQIDEKTEKLLPCHCGGTPDHYSIGYGSASNSIQRLS